MPTFDPDVFDPDVFDAEAPAGTISLQVIRNGVPVGLLFNNEQLGSFSFAMAAYDAQIGMGQMTVPGNPGWVAGDRISILSAGRLIYTGFVSDHSRARSGQPHEVQTTYQLMDTNRQLIGRKVVDWAEGSSPSADRLVRWIGVYLADLITLDTTWVDLAGSVLMPEKIYSGDGIMNLLADLILYTGKTLFMVPGSGDNGFDLHYHAFNAGIYAGLEIRDDRASPAPRLVLTGTPGDEFVDLTWEEVTLPVFAPQHPTANFSASDLKNVVEGRNGVTTTGGAINALSLALHGAGGLMFEALLDYSGLDTESLGLVINNVLNHAGDETPSYTMTIGPLTGAEVVLIPPGCLVFATSVVFGGVIMERLAHITLTVSRDLEGNPVPGYWDAALELATPLRLPAATFNLGGQGGDSGRLSNPPTWTDTQIAYDDPDIPAGSSTTVTAQLIDQFKNPVPVESVVLTWTLYQWEDEAETVAGTDYSLTPGTSDTDISGLAETVVSHDTDGATIKWWVTAGP